MRFLMLNWRDPANPKSGGAERVSLAYLEGLKERGHEVFWFANDFLGCKPQEVISGIQIVRAGGSGKSALLARRWYRQQKPFNLVIDQHHGIPWFAPWWSKTNCVAYIHEVLGPIWDAFYSWPLSAIGRWQERWTHWLYRNVPFWTPSESTKKALHANGVRRVTVFHNGTDAVPLAELESKPLIQPLRLIVVCRLAPNKRVEHTIKIEKMLLQRGIQAHLTIVGSGESEGQLRQNASQPDLAMHITFAGRLSEEMKNAELRRAHLLLHTSVREGWGLNVIEANAMGTPAVVYPVGGLVDSTLHNETGIVSPAETPQSLADCLVQLIKEPEKYDRLRVNAWERAKRLQWNVARPPVCDWLEKMAAQTSIQRS
jgi:glycosyltransferase involved in cell wall biosynthesis